MITCHVSVCSVYDLLLACVRCGCGCGCDLCRVWPCPHCALASGGRVPVAGPPWPPPRTTTAPPPVSASAQRYTTSVPLEWGTTPCDNSQYVNSECIVRQLYSVLVYLRLSSHVALHAPGPAPRTLTLHCAPVALWGHRVWSAVAGGEERVLQLAGS